MRNSTTLLILLLIVGMGFVAWLVVDPGAKDRVLASVGIICAVVSASAFSVVVGQKHSPHASGFGFTTSLEHTGPVNTVTLPDKDDPEHDVIMDIYPNNGCQPFWIRGGGKHGYTVARRDLVVTLPGDQANVWIYAAPPDIYTMNAGPKDPYKNLAQLPKELYMALRATDGWHDKAKVLVFYDPPLRELKDAASKVPFPYKKKWEEANEKLLHMDQDLNNLLETNTRYAEANKRNALSYGRPGDYYEPPRGGREEEDER